MTKKQETKAQTRKKLTPAEHARKIARDAADAYFAGLTSKVSFDTAPGKVNLVEVCNEVQDALLKDRAYAAREGAVEDAAFNAGFLMGIRSWLADAGRGGGRRPMTLSIPKLRTDVDDGLQRELTQHSASVEI